MKDHERILGRLTKAAARAPAPAVQLDSALATRVLARVRAAPRPKESDGMAFLEGWCIGALPVAAAVVIVLWLVGPRAGGPAAEGALAERIFAEALRS